MAVDIEEQLLKKARDLCDADLTKKHAGEYICACWDHEPELQACLFMLRNQNTEMVTPASILREAAFAVEADPTVYFVDILNRYEGQGLLTLDASHALNEYLEFPRGRWWDVQDRIGSVESIKALRAAADILEGI